MNFSDYADHDAVGIARLIKAKEVSAEEVTEMAIHVAERMNPKLNALVMTNFDNAQVLRFILRMLISSLLICRQHFPVRFLMG